MYFPYMRGKQFELKALRELAELIAEDGKVIPIIEPVKKNISPLKTAINEFKKENMPFVLICNPTVGELRENADVLNEQIISEVITGGDNCCLGYIITSKTETDDIKAFIESNSDFRICIIHSVNYSDRSNLQALMGSGSVVKYNVFIEEHTSHGYRKSFKDTGAESVIIRDGFQQQLSNKDYPDNEYFSDLHLVCKPDNVGFGDFLIVGKEYSETGGPAYAVVIHLTYLNDDTDLWIRHFVSVRKESPVDPAGKFLEALEKLKSCLDGGNCLIYRSKACDEFLFLRESGHFPGLGYVKKLSMMHHIELIIDTKIHH